MTAVLQAKGLVPLPLAIWSDRLTVVLRERFGIVSLPANNKRKAINEPEEAVSHNEFEENRAARDARRKAIQVRSSPTLVAIAQTMTMVRRSFGLLGLAK